MRSRSLRTLLDQLFGRLAETGQRLVPEPDDRAPLVARQFGRARDDPRDLAQPRLHRRAARLGGHGVAVDLGQLGQPGQRQAQALGHAARGDHVVIADIVEKGGDHHANSLPIICLFYAYASRDGLLPLPSRLREGLKRGERKGAKSIMAHDAAPHYANRQNGEDR